MGDPGKIRRKYDTPSHPWQRDRIGEEKKMLHEYGLKNKKEIWKMGSILKTFKDEAKRLTSKDDDQSKLEEKQLIARLVSLGVVSASDQTDKVLGLQMADVAARRLQTLLVKKGLARTMKQARQFITHGHVLVASKKITFPNYLVSVQEEMAIAFLPKSTLSRDDHPERVIKEVPKKQEKKKEEKKEEAPPTFAPEEIEKLEATGEAEPQEVK